MYLLVLLIITLLYIIKYFNLKICNYMFIFICLFVLLLTNSSVEKKFQKYWRKYYMALLFIKR